MQGIKNLDGKGKGYLALFITSVVWGTTWVASKMGVNEIPPLQMAYIRQLIAGICFVVFFIFYKKFSIPTLKQFRWIFVMAILMFVFANGLSTWSLKFIPTGEQKKKETVLEGIAGKRILCLANLRIQKNHLMLIDVAERLKKSHFQPRRSNASGVRP